jgi:WD40 repeat protein
MKTPCRETLRIAGLVAAALLCGCAGAPETPLRRPGDIPIDDTAVYPESITSSADGTVYTGSLKGVIFRARPDDARARAWARPSAEDGQQPAIYGVLAHDASQTMWVCTGRNPFQAGGYAPTALIALDMKTGARKGVHVFPGPDGVCNDIAVARDGTVYATDTRNARLLRVVKNGQELQIVGASPKLAGIDGLAFADDGTLYVNSVTLNTLVRVELRADGSLGQLTNLTLSQPIAGPDGLRPIGGHRFLQAEGTSGRITEVTIQGDTAQIRTLRDGLNSSPGVTLVGNTAYAIEGKIGYLVDPKLKGQDPGPFKILAIPLQ